jgi:hypothetical protein
MRNLLARFCQWMADSDRDTAEVCMQAVSLAFIRKDWDRYTEFTQAVTDLNVSANKWEARAERFAK